MCVAWIASTPSGMLMARYYKRTWRGIEPCGKDLWFRAHQGEYFFKVKGWKMKLN